MKYNVQYFPFSPNIPWKTKSNIIIPQIDSSIFNKAIDGRDINIISFGGLIETLLSLSILERIHYLHPNKNFYYSGNDNFNDLISMNGLCKLKQIDKDIIKKYPVPIFSDKENFVYFNCLNNYIDVFKYTGEYTYKNYHPIFKQILDNSCFQLNNIIKIRNLDDPKELNNSKRFSFDKPFVLICPDRIYSIHNESGLGWHQQNVKSLTAMLNSVDINVVIMTDKTERYFGINSLILKPNLKYLVWLIKRAKAVISDDVDIQLSGLLLSTNIKIFGNKTYKEFSLTRNAKIVKANNELYMSKDNLKPVEVFEEIKK